MYEPHTLGKCLMPHASRVTAKAVRKPGRPSHAERPINAEVLEQIARLWAKGWSGRKIAKSIGVHETSVRYHLKNTIKPLWRQQVVRPVELELAKIDHLETIAWEHFESDAPSESRENVEEALLEASRGKNGALTVVKKATSTIRKFGQTAWLDVVEWCISERCKLMGHNAAKDYRVSQDHAFRVAGTTPSDLDEAMLERVGMIVAQRREHRDF